VEEAYGYRKLSLAGWDQNVNVELAHGGEGVEDGEGWSIVAKTVGLFNTEPRMTHFQEAAS
jgi:hypothetical protein